MESCTRAGYEHGLPTAWKRGRRAAGGAGVVVLAAAGFATALVLAGGAFGQLPTTTITTPSVPTVTVTTPSVPIVPPTTITTPPAPVVTTTIIAPPVPTATVTTPRVTLPPPPPPAALPPPKSVGSPASPAGAPSSTASSPARSSSGSTRASTSGAAFGTQGSSGRSGGQSRTSTTAAVASAAFATTAHRPSQAPPYLFGLPSSGSVALDYGAFIMPGVGGRLGSLDLIGLTAGESDILALLGVPDFSRQRPAQAAQRPGRAGLSELRDVLGQQATLSGGLPLGQLPLLALGLVLFSSLLLIGAVLPPRVVARSPLTAASYARARQPLVIVAIGILIPVGLAALAIALSAPS